MRVSREQMAENRLRILQEAGRLFRERGFDAVTVADVMKAAGLTHGGFYGHFASKDDLIAQTIAHAQSSKQGEIGIGEIGDWIEAYLSPLHCDHAADGCPTAALAGFMQNQTPKARAAMATGIREQVDHLARTLPGKDKAGRRRVAIGSLSAMVGGIIVARAIDDPELRAEVLEQTRAWIDAGISNGSRTPSKAKDVA